MRPDTGEFRCELANSLQGLRRLRVLSLNFNFSPEAVARLAPLGATLTALTYAGDMTQTRSRRSVFHAANSHIVLYIWAPTAHMPSVILCVVVSYCVIL
jgi:hypothetical protein